MSVYQRIDKKRKELGVTWAHLNDVINGYRGKLTEVKNGKTTLSNEELTKIAAALHVSTDYLLGNTDDPRPVGSLTADDPQKKPAPQEGSELKKLTPDGTEISQEDLRYLAAFHAADENTKAAIRLLLKQFEEDEGAANHGTGAG